ncbi:hypothetical protein [Undibacterium oligocarboniphilum]|uniref:Uncharacterized protein n=1 Tax=Undibacterium oligocarboniphilum TaxID=666702 RepID=A0A850QB08_9BURK|nr:hypothetical protein [Undibacterium oligocarboniphilum]MBC3870908.1 hypothetical protein [Undibacterium oligocarboniphilum]NVO76469.1 hypothetical protein [Undibacterium oligocarboniphilum]
MKHSMMRVAVAATLGLSALAANAGTLAVNIGSTLAAEYVTAAAVVAQPNLTFATSSLLVSNTAVTFHVRPSAGTMVAVPAAANIVVASSNGTIYSATNANGSIASAATADADGKGYYFTVTAPSSGLPAGTTVSINQPAAPAAPATTLTGLNVALAAGGSVTAAVGYTSTPGDYAGVSTWIEAPVSATILNSAVTLSEKVTSSAAFATAETKVVDVSTGTLTTFKNVSTSNTTGTAIINLGSVALTVNGALKTPSGGTPAVADFGAVTVSAAGDFSAGTPSLTSDAACATAIAGVTTTVSTDKKSVVFSTIPVANIAAMSGTPAVPAYLCYTTAGAKQIQFPVQYTIGNASTVANVAGAGAVASVSSGGNAYNLTSNGSKVFVPSFVPQTGALGTGYNTYLRIINTGIVAADISAVAYDQNTGAQGTPAVVAPALKPNASVIVSTSDVTTKLGLPAGWSSLQVNGPTNALAVQPLLVNPQGVITNIGGVNGYTSNVGAATGSN